MVGYSDGVFTPPTGATTALPKDVIRSSVWNSTFTSISDALTDIGQGVAIEIVTRDGTAPLTPGVKGFLECPMALTIGSWKILADQSGSIVVSIWKTTFAGFPPTSGNVITGSAPPTIFSSRSASSSTLTGWTTTLSKGDILAFNVVSCVDIQQITLSLDCLRN